MNQKSVIWTGMVIGSAIGGYVPVLWGGSVFSLTSVFLTAVGGVAGIWAGFKLSR